MAYLFVPPTRKQTTFLEGSLRVSYPVSWTVFNIDGVWQAMETPSEDALDAATHPLPGVRCDRPQIVPDDTAAELLAALPALNASLPAGITGAECIPIQT